MRTRWGRERQRTPEAVYRDLAPAVLGYFRSQRMADPEGLTGDVFVAVTERLARFEGDDAALRRWVFTIAHHRRVDEIRRAGRRPAQLELDDDTETVLDSTRHDPELPDPELLAALWTLTEEQREVVVLRFVADLSVADVAELSERSEGAVKMLSARGLDALRAALGDTEESSPDA